MFPQFAFITDTEVVNIVQTRLPQPPLADDLGDCQHGHGEEHARNSPHPEPEDEHLNTSMMATS
jgi:hypothetical protein